MAEKLITRTAIAEFYLTSEEDGSRRHIVVGQEVELTRRQFEKYVAARCVLKDDDQNMEVKARATRAQAKGPTPASVPNDRTEMRTEAGERAAREQDAAAREAAAVAARREAAAKEPIPDTWRELNAEETKALAMKLGATEEQVKTKATAAEFIEAELKRRAS